MRKESHLKEDVGKFNSNAVSGPAAEGTKEVLVACIPAHTQRFTGLNIHTKCQETQKSISWRVLDEKRTF